MTTGSSSLGVSKYFLFLEAAIRERVSNYVSFANSLLIELQNNAQYNVMFRLFPLAIPKYPRLGALFLKYHFLTVMDTG